MRPGQSPLMETLTKIAWAVLALVHFPPTLVVFVPSMIERLYGIVPSHDVGVHDVGVLIVHRGALFGAIFIACLFAMMTPALRRAMACLVAISIISFLMTYVSAGMPEGLRRIAIIDFIALVPLIFVMWQALRS